MAALGPRVRRDVARAVSGGAGGRVPLLPAATRMPAVPWQVRDAFLVLGAGLLFLVVALIVTLGLAQLQSADAQATGPRDVISTLVTAGFFLFTLWMTWLLIKNRYRVSWRTMGLRMVSWQWLVTVPFINVLLTFFDVLMLRAMVAVFGDAGKWPQPLTSSTVHATQQPLLAALVIVTSVLITPVVEELLFRGVLYQALRRRMPVSNAAVLSALVFAVMHGNPVLFIPFTVMGVILALVYERSGSLIPTILVHACNNGIILWIVLFWASNVTGT